MKKHILPVACMAALLMAGGVISSCSDIDPVHSLELSRVLSPTNLSVRVRNSVNLELSWDAMDKATSYTVEVYEAPLPKVLLSLLKKVSLPILIP